MTLWFPKTSSLLLGNNQKLEVQGEERVQAGWTTHSPGQELGENGFVPSKFHPPLFLGFAGGAVPAPQGQGNDGAELGGTHFYRAASFLPSLVLLQVFGA